MTDNDWLTFTGRVILPTGFLKPLLQGKLSGGVTQLPHQHFHSVYLLTWGHLSHHIHWITRCDALSSAITVCLLGFFRAPSPVGGIDQQLSSCSLCQRTESDYL